MSRFIAPADAGIYIPHALQSRLSIRTGCPKCARKRDDALHLNFNSDGTWIAFCHRCHTSYFSGTAATIAAPRPIPMQPTRKIENVVQRWARLAPWRDTPVEGYLLARTSTLPPDDADLRFEPRAWHWLERRNLPAMVALVTDAVTGAPLTLHRTFIKPDGSGKAAVAKTKLLAIGLPKKHGVVRLSKDSTNALGVSEGIETSLAASRIFAQQPMWAAIDAGNLAALPVVGGVKYLLIAADNDTTGLAAANDCAKRWLDAGRRVRIACPEAESADFADEAIR